VPEGLQGLDRQFDDFAARLAVDGADQADAAGVALGGRIIGVAVDQALAVGQIVLDLLAHDLHSAAISAEAPTLACR
jgi:hypothetical protein